MLHGPYKRARKRESHLAGGSTRQSSTISADWTNLCSRKRCNLLIILLIVLILAFGAFPAWPYSRSWGYYPSGGLGLVLVILLILVLVRGI
jgi:hypothetical protein